MYFCIDHFVSKNRRKKYRPENFTVIINFSFSKKKNNLEKTGKELGSSLKQLGSRELRSFRKIFDDFDLEKSGTLTAEELHECVNKLAGYEALTFSDTLQILNDLDVKGTGDIEFDEFIYFMTRPQVTFA